MKPQIKIETIRTEKQFIDCINSNNLRFYGMYLSDEVKTGEFWIKAYSDVPINEIITVALEKAGFGYIAYAGKINDKYCVAAEIKS